MDTDKYRREYYKYPAGAVCSREKLEDICLLAEKYDLLILSEGTPIFQHLLPRLHSRRSG